MTSKQQVVAKDLLENTGKSVSRAMLDAGYAPSTAKNPQQLTRSKAWQKLMEDYLSDEYLIKKHKELLNVRTFETFEMKAYADEETMKEIFSQIPNLKVIKVGWPDGLYKDRTTVFFSFPDYRTQIEALKLGYKLRAKI